MDQYHSNGRDKRQIEKPCGCMVVRAMQPHSGRQKLGRGGQDDGSHGTNSEEKFPILGEISIWTKTL